MKPQVLRQAPDSDSGPSAETKSKHKQVSKRSLLGGEKIEEATGARYTLLAPSGNLDFDFDFSPDSKFKTMCAIFGFHTKVGNVANSVLNDRDEPGSPVDAGEAIKAWVAAASDPSDPEWAERATGGPGVRIDKDALAGAIIEVGEAAGKKTAKNGKPFTYDVVRELLESDPQYVRAARQVPDVADAYSKRVGRPSKTVDDL